MEEINGSKEDILTAKINDSLIRGKIHDASQYSYELLNLISKPMSAISVFECAKRNDDIFLFVKLLNKGFAEILLDGLGPRPSNKVKNMLIKAFIFQLKELINDKGT